MVSRKGASPEAVPEIGTRYGLTFHPELIAELWRCTAYRRKPSEAPPRTAEVGG